MKELALVAVGGGAGAALRHVVGISAVRLFGTGFPLGTLFVNVAGSFAMGLLVVWLSRGAGEAHALRPLLGLGLLGGFTTFSSFSLDALVLWERGDGALAAAYVVGSVALALFGIAGGFVVGRALF